MPSVLSKLRKVLLQEQGLGFQDRAVIGGLSKFVDFCQQEASPEEQALIQEVALALRGYESLTLEQCSETIQDVLESLSQDRPEDSPPPAQAPPPEEASSSQSAEPPLAAPISSLKGISDVHAKHLSKLGVKTVADLLHLFPRRYDDFSNLKTIAQLTYGEEVTIIGTIDETSSRIPKRHGGPKSITTSVLFDGTGSIEATWFNQPYLTKRLKAGRQIAVSGLVGEFGGRLVFASPEWEPFDRELIHTGRLVPVYPLTKGLGPRWTRNLMKRAVDTQVPRLEDHLPPSIRGKRGLVDLPTALSQIHFPGSWDSLRTAQRRLSFDELLLIQLGVIRQRQRWRARPAKPLARDAGLLDSFINSLPFPLTASQEKALSEILDDMRQEKPMNRLLQGDVGSGKTVVAVAALLTAVVNGCQGALMVPTEILAEQHTHSLQQLLAGLPAPPSVCLLTGSLKAAAREARLRELAAGQVDIAVGTHALFQEGVTFHNLGLAIIDEQHRFGVLQRAAIKQKGHNPHALVMSATPIPRTLALTVYGDLDISVIDELPPGRQEIATKWLSPLERERAYTFIRRQIEAGHQAFIICPLVQESDRVNARSATAEHERLQQEIFPDLRLGLLHGRLPSDEKERVMAQFQRGELDILISTAVVEVGIDVPNATVMLVEGADRFGLSQLHQFRGRVGRGEHRSYCLLLAESPSEEARCRLEILAQTQDGFVLAEEDLKLRGPGEFFGTRQSGLPALRIANLADIRAMEEAREEGKRLLQEDPALEAPEHRLLAQALEDFWRSRVEIS